MIILPKDNTEGIQVEGASPTWPWRDLIGDVRPDPLGANAPALSAFRGGSCRAYAYSATDKIDCEFHLPHDYVIGTDIHAHVHWGHNGTAISGNIVFTLAYTYAKGHDQAIFPAEKSQTITFNTTNITTTPRYRHRIDEIVISDATGSGNYLNRANFEPDGILLLNMTMTTIPTITGGSPNEPFVFYVDLHYQSTGVGTKQKAPNFYV